jgi:hypothetical protein
MEGYKDTDIILKTLWDEPGCGKVFFYVIDETEHEEVAEFSLSGEELTEHIEHIFKAVPDSEKQTLIKKLQGEK